MKTIFKTIFKKIFANRTIVSYWSSKGRQFSADLCWSESNGGRTHLFSRMLDLVEMEYAWRPDD